MAPKKRARTATTLGALGSSSSSPPAGAVTKLTLRGGVPHHPSLAGLWRDERLTDFALCAEGVESKAHQVALASSSKYYQNLFESGMRDARRMPPTRSSSEFRVYSSLSWTSIQMSSC